MYANLFVAPRASEAFRNDVNAGLNAMGKKRTGGYFCSSARCRASVPENSGESYLGTYIPRVDVRMILTGFSSRISRTSRFPELAAARAKALRDKDDDFGS